MMHKNHFYPALSRAFCFAYSISQTLNLSKSNVATYKQHIATYGQENHCYDAYSLKT